MFNSHKLPGLPRKLIFAGVTLALMQVPAAIAQDTGGTI